MSHLCGVLSLPALSVGAPKLLATLQSEDLSLKELAEHLRLDPGISARLLHIANSPFFGVSGQVSSIEEAVMMLGMRRARTFIHVEVFRGLVNTPPWNQADLSSLWRYAVRIASTCQDLAARAGFTDLDAFTAGLFHNMGCLVLLQQSPVEYARLLTITGQGKSLVDAEQPLFHTNHAEMGASVLQQWHFPQEVCEAVAEQYSTSHAAHSILQLILQLAHQVHQPLQEGELTLGDSFRLLNLPWPGESEFHALKSELERNAESMLNLLGD